MKQSDLTIVGGGIVGLATAFRFLETYPKKKVVVLEKERDLAHHQTGHNSGVLHSGIYYKPGSLKAVNCREGKLAMQDFCEKQEIPFHLCGKVIVAISESEVPALEKIYERGQANRVNCEIIDEGRLKELEPHTAGIKAIHVPEAGIVDYRQVCERLAMIVKSRGSEILTEARVDFIHQTDGRCLVKSTGGEVESSLVINCCGLHSDRVARMSGQKVREKIVPFRGEYFELKKSAEHLCRSLVYPVPNPKFPFLGVHFTQTIQGGVECGPNAVLAFAREGYRKTDINLQDLFESLTYPGFLRLVIKHWKIGVGEMWRSFSKKAFAKALSRLIPEIRVEHLKPAPAGVRAQALERNGKLVDDFLIMENERIVNVCNAPSPAATSALNIGKSIVEKLSARF